MLSPDKYKSPRLYVLDLIKHLTTVEKSIAGSNPTSELTWLAQTEDPKQVYQDFNRLKVWAEENMELLLKVSSPEIAILAKSADHTARPKGLKDIVIDEVNHDVHVINKHSPNTIAGVKRMKK